MRPKYDPGRFLEQIREMIENIHQAYKQESNILINDKLRSRVRALEKAIHLIQAPAQVLERKMHLPSAYLIIPIFSLANAGIPFDFSALGNIITHPVSIGI